MWLWIGLLVGFVVVLLVGWRIARHVREIEEDSAYLVEEQQFTPFGQKFVNILLGRRGQ